MGVSKETIEEIRRRADILDVVQRYVRMERRGDRWWGLSPFKSEKTPSFSVKPAEGFYYCFATSQGGDVFNFVMKMENMEFPDAVKHVGEIVGVDVADGTSTPESKQRTALLELHRRVANTFHYLLVKQPSYPMEYLEKRGISRETVDRFQLGFAPEDGSWLYRFLRSKNFSDALLKQSGLFSSRYPSFAIFRNRIVFPVVDERGKHVAFGGRALDPNARAKYINSPETTIYKKKRTLYGLYDSLPTIRKTKTAFVLEGYLDVLATIQAGVDQAVAPLGTAFTDEQAQLLHRYAERVVFVFDADEAGASATRKAALAAEKTGLEPRAVALPEGKDPADIVAEEGAEELQRHLNQHVPVFDYLLDKSASRRDVTSIRDRALILNDLFPYIIVVSSEVRRQTYLGALADRLQVQPEAVFADFAQWKSGPEDHTGRAEVGAPHHISVDLHLMLAVVVSSELFAYLRSRLEPGQLKDRRARDLFLILEDGFRRGDMSPQYVMERLEDEEFRSLVIEKLTSGAYAGITKAGVDQALNTILIRTLKERQQELDRLLRQAVEPEETKKLLEEKIAVDQEIKTRTKAGDHD